MKRASGKTKRTKCDGRKAREALLNAAKELFANLVFEGVTVSAICKRAGLSGTQVHYHFRDKIHLYRTLLNLVGEGEIERLTKLLIPSSTPMEFRLRLELFVSEYLGWRAKDELTFKIVNHEYLRGMPLAKDIFEAKFNSLRLAFDHYLSQAKETGTLRADFDSAIVVTSLFGAMNTVEISALGDEANRARMAAEIVKTLITGLQTNANSKVTPEDRHASSK